jgi:hypothetical protein
MTTYSCNIYHQNFTDKNIRDTHRKNICIFSVIVKKQNGEEETVERVNGKFNCNCGRSFSRTDHFSSHWKECQIQGLNSIRIILTIGTMSRKKTYSQILTVDGFYNLITCKACNIGLPHEWAKSHSVKHKVTVAFLMKSN